MVGYNFPIKRTPITQEYEITQTCLGSGINGNVIRCIHKATGKPCALKILGDDEKAYREVELHYRVSDCENIVRMVDIFENNDVKTGRNHLLIVMECMEGGELFNRIQRRHRNGFTENDAARIVYQIATAVQCLHGRNIAHRDLKPENLLFTSDTADATLKLTDFGFAKETSKETFLLSPCFTPYYVAPEVLGTAAYDQQCDMWSLGVITYILLCGYPPFYSQGGDPFSPGMKSRIRNGHYTFPPNEWDAVSQEAKDLINRLLIVQPQQRLTIAQVMQHPWVVRHRLVPQTPLLTVNILNEERQNWNEVQEGFREGLQTMRTGSGAPQLKKLTDASNPILKRRKVQRARTAHNDVSVASASSSGDPTAAASNKIQHL
ncbi:MAP kinase activated protein kinase 2 [Echinococcus multilocularis]|uniref:non-specific serine/threonine protein kinase n=1 Tax=Echinococcus multilocularis TaxID=6211 RepID=A0A068YG78_ECHMU|nr:MAP kinase activated protein kinase 2 [Echinococcus multilocularis]